MRKWICSATEAVVLILGAMIACGCVSGSESNGGEVNIESAESVYGPQGWIVRWTDRYPSASIDDLVAGFGSATITVAQTVIHRVPDNDEDDAVIPRVYDFESSLVLRDFFETNGYAQAEVMDEPIILPAPRGNQGVVMDDGMNFFPSYLVKHPITTDYLITVEIITLEWSEAGEGVWGIECYYFDREGRNVISFVLNEDWPVFSEERMFAEDRADLSLSELAKMAARVVADTLSTHFRIEYLLRETVDFEGHSYQLMARWDTWDDAAERCAEMNGHIVDIESAAENDFIWNTFQVPIGTSLYLGASDEDREGWWIWPNGARVRYENWANGEPNDVNNEDQAEMVHDGTWNDIQWPLDAYLYYVCEWDSSR
jgi:hypothetical protein